MVAAVIVKANTMQDDVVERALVPQACKRFAAQAQSCPPVQVGASRASPTQLVSTGRCARGVKALEATASPPPKQTDGSGSPVSAGGRACLGEDACAAQDRGGAETPRAGGAGGAQGTHPVGAYSD